MSRIVSKLSLAVLLSAVSCVVACGSDDSVDGTPAIDAGSDVRIPKDSPSEAAKIDARETGPDAGTDAGADTAAPDGGAVDTGQPDTAQDTGRADAPDAGRPDTAAPDTGTPDTAAPDTGTRDTGMTDVRPTDTGLPDVSVADMGAPDSGSVETGSPDAGTDVGSADTSPAGDGGSACAAFNNGGGCTPTEQRFVDRSPACYECMANAGCLNDDLFADTNHECADVTGNAAVGVKTGTARAELCLDALDCALQTSCGKVDVALCYCGNLGAGNSCSTAPAGAPDGPCLQKELDGLEQLVSDAPSVVLPNFTGLALGAGMANQLFNCAKANDCIALCFP